MARYKQAKSVAEFGKIIRKYWKRYHAWCDKKGKWHRSGYKYRIYVSYIVDSVEKAKEAMKHRKILSYGEIGFLQDLIDNYGKTMKFDDRTGILKGIEITNEDIYWIYEDTETGKKVFETCVCPMKSLARFL